jgi:hypothetical protein
MFVERLLLQNIFVTSSYTKECTRYLKTYFFNPTNVIYIYICTYMGNSFTYVGSMINWSLSYQHQDRELTVGKVGDVTHVLCCHLLVHSEIVRYQVLTAASMKMTAFRDTAPCSLVPPPLGQ